MCVIVDANRASRFANPEHPDSRPLHRWVQRNRIIYCIEGDFDREKRIRCLESTAHAAGS